MEEKQDQVIQEKPTGTPGRIKAGWLNMPRAKRMVLTTGVAVAIVGSGVYAMSLGNSDYVVLYGDLDYEDAGEIKQALVENGVTDYKIGEDGSSILVKSSEVNSIRMDLAVNGVAPTSGTGYEIFDNSQLGMTEQERQIMYQRALEGELQRSIISLDSVEDARVHLNLTEETVFMRDQQSSTASIVLNLKRNASITESQVKGIIALVAGAVQNLEASSIEVIDSNGNLLSAGQGTDSTMSGGDRINQETSYEGHLEEKVRAQLGKVFGYDKIAVSVRVNLNQTSEEQRKEEYTEGTVLSEQTQFSRVEGDTTVDAEGGGPVDNNMQNTVVEGEDALQDPDILEYDNTTNHQPSVTETHTVKPPGEIEKITVSVIYNGELTQPLMEELERQISSMVGINGDRGDSVSVAGIPFNAPEIEESIFESESKTLTAFDWFLYGTLGLSTLAFVGFLISKSRKKKDQEIVYGSELLNGSLDEPISNELQEEFADFISKSQVDPVDTLDHQLREILNFFQSEPESGMDLLRIWMNDDETIIPGTLDLPGMEKVARFLVVLGVDIAGEVMKYSSQDEVIKLAHLMTEIRSVSFQQSVALIEEYSQMIEARRFVAQGGYDFAKSAMTSALGVERTEQLLRQVKGVPRNRRPFEIIRTMDASQLYNALSEEHPQTIALVLCYLPSEKAAAIISELPEQLQLEVTQRIGMMNNTSAQIVDEVEHVIEARLQSLMSADMTAVGGLNTIVDILNAVDRGTQKHIIDLLAEATPHLAEEVRDNLFTFEDLSILDNATIQRIIREVEANTLAVSLKGASESIFTLITKNMSTRAAERLQDDIDFLGPVRLSEVEKAQHEIITVVRRLEDAGEIIVSRGGKNDVVY